MRDGGAANGAVRDGAVVRALASHQCGPGSNPGVDAICGLSLLLVFSLAARGFSPGTPVFSSPQKPTFPNFQLDQESGRRRTTLWMCYRQIIIIIIIIIIIVIVVIIIIIIIIIISILFVILDLLI